MLHQLHGRFVQDQFLSGETKEERAARRLLLRTRLGDFLGIDADKSDRRFGAIELGVVRCSQNEFSVVREKINRFVLPKCTQPPGQFFFRNRLQRPVKRKETSVAAKISASWD